MYAHQEKLLLSEASLGSKARGQGGESLQSVMLGDKFDELVASHANMANFGMFSFTCICIYL
jgi:hypothetical protein